MTYLSLSMIFIFSAVAFVHALWALRIWWPIPDEAELARTVVGSKGIAAMPSPGITWAVVGVICLGILWTLFLSEMLDSPFPAWLTRAGGIIMAGVLLVRGIGSYFAPLFGAQFEAPFHQLNRAVFSPLIIALGLGVLVLTLG